MQTDRRDRSLTCSNMLANDMILPNHVHGTCYMLPYQKTQLPTNYNKNQLSLNCLGCEDQQQLIK